MTDTRNNNAWADTEEYISYTDRLERDPDAAPQTILEWVGEFPGRAQEVFEHESERATPRAKLLTSVEAVLASA